METVSVIEKYNDLFIRIQRAKSVEDMRALFGEVRKFHSVYRSVDGKATTKIYDKYLGKLGQMVEDNSAIYNRLQEKMNHVQGCSYDFVGEKDITPAVDNMTRQLMARLPHEKTAANAATITNTIEGAIKSGVVGCRAVLELLKYPEYKRMPSDGQRQRAYDGSKTLEQRAFDAQKESDQSTVKNALTQTYMEGFHLRTIQKKAISYQQSSAWAE